MASTTPTRAEPTPPKNHCECMNNFINNYLPENEQTYNFAIPIIGFSSSCISFGIFMTFIHNYKNPVYVNHTMYNYGYMVLSGACALDLYYGLRNRNRKQYFFWILMKLIEMILIITAIVHSFLQRYWNHDFIVISIILIFVKLMLMYYILRRATSKRNRSVIPAENMYDIPSPQAYENTAYVTTVY